MVLIGLITVFWKIYRQKSVYYLFRVNAWAAIVLLVGATMVNWDVVIVKYNLSRKNEIVMEVHYMVILSDRVLPILDSNKEELKRHEKLMKVHGFGDPRDCEGCWQKVLDDRTKEYKAEQINYSWLSWNLADEYIGDYFNIKIAAR